MRSGIRLVIVLLVFAFVISIGGLLMLWLIVGAEPPVPSSATLVLRMTATRSRAGPDDGFSQFLPVQREPSVRGLVENIRKAKVDRRVARARGAAHRPRRRPTWPRSRKCATRSSTSAARASRSSPTSRTAARPTYYLATACDRIFLMPSSPLELTGIASYELFLRGTLDKIGAYPDMLHIGDYKTAPNQLTEKTLHAGAPRDGRVAQPRRVRAAGAGDCRRPQEERGRRARADRRGAVPARGRAARRPGRRRGVRGPARRQGEGPARQGARGSTLDELRPASAPASLGLDRGPRIAVIYAVGHDRLGPQRLRPDQRRRCSAPTRSSSTSARSASATDISGDRPAHRQPGRIGDRLRRDLARAGADARREARDGRSSSRCPTSPRRAATTSRWRRRRSSRSPARSPGSIGIFGGKIVTGGDVRQARREHRGREPGHATRR